MSLKRNLEEDTEERILKLLKEEINPEVEEEVIDKNWCSKHAQELISILNTNKEERLTFKSDPMKFMDSENRLYEKIKEISVISTANPLLLNDYFNLLGESLGKIIAHPNSDIFDQLVLVLMDFFDGSEWQEWMELLLEYNFVGCLDQHIVEKSFDDLLVSLCHYSKFVDAIFDAEQIYQSCIDRFGSETIEFLSLFFTQLPQLEVEGVLNQYEFLMDSCLVTIAKNLNTPATKNSELLEFAENTVILLCSLVTSRQGRKSFEQYEGVPLMLKMINSSSTWCITSAMKVLNRLVCYHSKSFTHELVANGFLKRCFTNFAISPLETVSLVNKLFCHLPSLSEERLRLVNKFVAKDAKNLRLFIAKTKELESLFEFEKLQDDDEYYLDSLDNGLSLLQQIYITFAWLVAEDLSVSQACTEAGVELNDDAINVLSLYSNGLVLAEETASDEIEKTELYESHKSTERLIEFLEGLDL